MRAFARRHARLLAILALPPALAVAALWFALTQEREGQHVEMREAGTPIAMATEGQAMAAAREQAAVLVSVNWRDLRDEGFALAFTNAIVRPEAPDAPRTVLGFVRDADDEADVVRVTIEAGATYLGPDPAIVEPLDLGLPGFEAHYYWADQAHPRYYWLHSGETFYFVTVEGRAIEHEDELDLVRTALQPH